MSFVRLGELGILLKTVQSVSLGAAPPPPPPPPPPPGTITPAVLVSYVDPTGARQIVDPLGSSPPTITGVAPMLVTIDATGTRAPTAYAAYTGSEAMYLPASYPASTNQTALAQEAYAHLSLGYRINYGGGTGAGNWAYPEGQGASKNEDAGQPLWPAVFTEVGTHLVRIRIRDELGNETTVSFNVVVQAAPAATNIPVSAGSWPTFTSGSRDTLDAGGDYRSFGPINTGNLHNVIFEKVGSGADPRITTWNVDPRSKFGETTMFPTRARHVRMIGIDMDLMSEGQRGFDFCGAINCRTRRYVYGAQTVFFSEGTSAEQSACRYTRGCFFVGGELNNIGTDNGFTLFGTWHSLVLLGCLVNATDTGPTTWLVARVYGTKHMFRHSKFRISHAETTSCGTPVSLLAEDGFDETVWPDNDRPAPIGATTLSGLRNDHSHIYKCQYYDATSSRANAVFSTGGNPSGLRLVRPTLIGSEDCVFFQTGSVAITDQNYRLSGRAVYLRNSRRNMGAGSALTFTTLNPNSIGNPGNTDTAWDGPYGGPPARPVPTAF